MTTKPNKRTGGEKKLWIAVCWNDSPTTFQWMVEVDLNKPFKFVQLSSGSIGFTQIIDEEKK